MEKTELKKMCLVYAGSVVVIAVLLRAELLGAFPFGAAVFAAFCGGLNAFILAPIYIVLSYAETLSLPVLYAAIASGGLAMALQGAKSLFRVFTRPLAARLGECAVILIYALVVFFFLPLTTFVITIFFGLASYWFYVQAERVIVEKRLRAKPNAVDSCALCVVAFTAALTFSDLSIYNVNIGVGISAAIIFAIVVFGGALPAIGASIMIGLANAFALEPYYAAAFALGGVLCSAFRSLPRPVCAFSFLLGYAGAVFVLGGDAIISAYECAAIAVGCAFVCAIPSSFAKRVTEYFAYDESLPIVTRHFINRTRRDEGNALMNAAAVFDEMAALIARKAPSVNMRALSNELRSTVCEGCDNALCPEAARLEAFDALVSVAINSKVLVNDLPRFFTTSCSRPAEALHYACAVNERVKNKRREAESDERARTIIVDRFKGVSTVLSQMARRFAEPLSFCRSAEEGIIRELSFHDIDCAEAFAAPDSVTMLCRTSTYDKARVEAAVTKYVGVRFAVISADDTRAAGWTAVYLKKAPRYEVVFAQSGVAKDGVSGDVYTFSRIENKFFAALADGMGTGEAAARDSAAAVDLIECFYKAGFDSSSALKSVNSFLQLPASEAYSAADVCVIDLETAACDIIKIGAPPTYIKTSDSVLKLESSSLPIGVLEEMRPYTVTRKVTPGQMIVLTTDGVADAFIGDELPDIINNLSLLNPKAVADKILDEAKKRSSADDMTVIAMRVFLN